MNPTLPCLHLNGTGRDALLQAYRTAYYDLREAISSFSAIDFHPRDYYPLGLGAWPQAQTERTCVAHHLAQVCNYLEAHLVHLAHE